MLSSLRRPAVALIATTLTASVLGLVPAAHAAPLGSISGHLTTDGVAITEDVTVATFQVEGDDWVPTGEGRPDENGDYTVEDLAAGDYVVTFQSRFGTYVLEAYDNVTDVEDADPVTVGDGEAVAGIDADLALAGQITGTVEDGAGEPLVGAYVSAFSEVPADGGGTTWEYAVAGAEVDENGAYTIDRLAEGTYRVEFNQDGYQTEYFDDVATVEEGTDVDVVAGEATPDISAVLAEDATISGTVVDADNEPLADVRVGAEVEGSDRPVFARTDDAGRYTLDELAAGSYVVSFALFDEATEVYLGEYYDNVGSIEDATPVAVEAGEGVERIDAKLVEDEHETVPLTVENVTPVAITGTPQVGSPLTSSAGTWTPDPTLVEYYWVAGEELLQSGTSATYVPTAADLGKVISVHVFASIEGYDYGWSTAVASGPVVAAPVPPVATPPVVTPPVVTPPVVTPTAALAAILEGVDVKGTAKVGKTLKLSGLDKLFRRSTTVGYTFQWFAGKKAIKKATKSTLKVTKPMKGKKISVKVTAKAASATKSIKLTAGKVR